MVKPKNKGNSDVPKKATRWSREAKKRVVRGAPNGDERKKSQLVAPKDTAPKEKFVVVVKNVENNMAAIHSDALARFLGVNRKCEKSSGTPRFNIAVRTETRTAQVDFFYDESNAEELFNHPHPVPEKKENQQKKANGSADAAAETEAETKVPQVKVRNATEMLARLAKSRYFEEKLEPRLLTSGALEEDVGGTAKKSNDFVSVEASTTLPLGENQLGKLLGDVPGFVRCWKIAPKRFRAVFETKDVLFAAKTLLDAFEADGIRVTLSLPGFMTDEYTEYLENRTA